MSRDLLRRLVQQHGRAADHRAGPGRAASAVGHGVVDDVEQRPRAARQVGGQRVGGAGRQRADHHVGLRPAPAAVQQPDDRRRTPSRSAAASSGAGPRRRPGPATRGPVAQLAPARRARTPPSRRRRAPPPRSARATPGLGQRGRRCPARRCCRPAPAARRSTTVLAAPVAAASVADRRRAAAARLLERHGQRQPGPLRAEPVEAAPAGPPGRPRPRRSASRSPSAA